MNLELWWQTQQKSSDALRDLVSFVQFKARDKHPWRSVTFSKVAGLYKWYQIPQSITYLVSKKYITFS